MGSHAVSEDGEGVSGSRCAMIKLIQGDCLDVMRGMADNSVDLVLTDPPYGKNSDKGTNGFGAAVNRRYESAWDCNRPPKEYFDEMLRISKNAIIFGANFFSDVLPPSNHWIFWDKKGDIAFKNPFADGELIFTTFNKPVRRIVFKQQGFITDSKDKRFHPTQKPTELLALLINEYSSPGAVIFDGFMGSGSTGVAAVSNGRSFIGVEMDTEYFNVAQARINGAGGQ